MKKNPKALNKLEVKEMAKMGDASKPTIQLNPKKKKKKRELFFKSLGNAV